MSITKNQLKAIVKECLVEILAEGIGASAGQSLFEIVNKKNSKPVMTNHVTNQQKVVSKNRSIPSMPSSALKEAIKRESGGDKVLADILADTAANSLPTMLENDRAKAHLPPTGTVERIVAAASPDQLFGEEAASKWASLAFMDPVKK